MRKHLPFVHAGAALLAGCLLWTQADVQEGAFNPFPQLIHEFEEDQGNLKRYYRFHDLQLDHDRLAQFYQDYQSTLEDISFDLLSQEGRVDYLLFRNLLDQELGELAYTKQRADEVSEWLPFQKGITALAAARRSTAPMDASGAATALTMLQEQIKAIDEKFTNKDTKLSTIHTNRVIQFTERLSRRLANWYRFYDGYDPDFNWWTRAPYEEVSKALETYLSHLREAVGDEDTVIGDPIGRPALLQALKREFITYTPEELIDMAQKEYLWCMREWRRVAQDLEYENDWRKALEHVKGKHVDPGDQPALIKELAQEAVDFLEARDLVTIPPVCKETWRMEMMTAERQKVNPYFTGGEVISVSFPTHAMAHDDKLMSLRGNNRHFCKATVHHELIPGHHLQLYMQERHRAYRKIFRTPFLVEGWALYWEMLLWDKEFYSGPEDRAGMLFWRTHRCARIIFSLKFHLGQMTAEECINYLVDNVGHERRNATAEVRRSVQGGYEPLYQAAYMLGGLQFRALRKELVDSGQMTERDFHDAILLENSIPVDLIRISLGGHPVDRQYESSWRFYHEEAKTPASE